MALFLPGRTRCAACREVIGHDDEVVMFPPGLFADRSVLARFNDASAHRACLTGDELWLEALEARDFFLRDPVAFIRSLEDR
ncbi:hypothetical protein [Catellatospora sichuanensis]|uniref:hypothetical protein n=1 Tax=Catellatospora sichuanensis TaxID=1969805 RepID=UPI001182F0DE|nr:hypothetical protein [Catellatospora sichuanensis]